MPPFRHFGIWLPPSGNQIPKWRVIAGEDSGVPERLIANFYTHPTPNFCPFSPTLEYGYRLAAIKFQSGELLPRWVK